jgi:ABC-2 type transport system ATP-binding protein
MFGQSTTSRPAGDTRYDSDPELAVEVVGLQKQYGGVRALTGLDLRVHRGTVFSLLGPNGAGKTTAIRILATLTKPDAGRALVGGWDVVLDRHRVRSAISLTGQYAALDPMQTGEENLEMIGRLSGLSSREARRRASELLGLFDLEPVARRRVATYSGGTCRRLDLAVSLVRRPTVMFLDEPTTGLDVRGRQAIWSVIGDLAASGVTIFLTTQYLEEADSLANEIAIIDEGSVIALGSSEELKRRIGRERLDLVVRDSFAFDDVRHLLGSRVVRAERSELTIAAVTDGTAANVRQMLDEVDPHKTLVTRFEVVGATLDDVFLTVTSPRASAAPSPPPHSRPLVEWGATCDAAPSSEGRPA